MISGHPFRNAGALGLLALASFSWADTVVLNSGQALEGTIVELRAQNQKACDDFAKIREQLSSENGARVKAETQLAETVQRLAEEKKLLDDAKAKLTDTFKALAGDTLNNNTDAFLKLAKETLDKVLTDVKGDLGKRQEAIQGVVKPLAESITKFEEHVRAIEKTGAFRGLYHVLQGAIAPLEGIGPELLKIDELLCRLSDGMIQEVVLATDADRDGETTAAYLAKLLRTHNNLKLTRLASGIPVGSHLEYADQATLAKALEGRREL
jgi:predicted nuclease with TOPRIM domain